MNEKVYNNKHEFRRHESSSTCLSTSSSSTSGVAASNAQNGDSLFVAKWDEIEILEWQDLESGQKKAWSRNCGGSGSQKQPWTWWFRRRKVTKIAIIILTMTCLWMAVYFGAKKSMLGKEESTSDVGYGSNNMNTGKFNGDEGEKFNFTFFAEGDKGQKADVGGSGEQNLSDEGKVFENDRIFPTQSPQTMPLQNTSTDAPTTQKISTDVLATQNTSTDAPSKQNGAPTTMSTKETGVIEPEEIVVLHRGESLTPGQFRYAPNGRFKVGLAQSDGNLVLLEVDSSGESVIWSSGTSSGVDPNASAREVKCSMQDDGNLVLRDVQTRQSLWMTKTHGNPQARLVLDDFGRVAVRSDDDYRTVLWMDGLPRQKYTGPSSTDMTFPIRGAFYYPWYPSTWHVDGHRAHYDTSLGMYSSSDPIVANAHIDAMDFGRIQLSISSWWGPSTNLDRARLTMLMDETIARKSHLKWTVYHEDERDYDPTPEELGADLDYLKKWFTWHEAWAHIDGKPVIFVYNEAGCEVASRWVQASRNEWYVVLKLFSGFEDCPNQPDSWHQYGVGKKDGIVQNPGHSFVVAPGFWKADTDIPLLKRLDRTEFCENTQKMVESGEPWQLIVSFNEAGEGTLIEPSPNWKSDSGYGDYLDCLHNSHT